MSELQRITIPVPDNWHCHLREGALLPFMVDHLIDSGFTGRVLAMPNLTDPILNGKMAEDYEAKILSAIAVKKLSLVDQSKFEGFQPVVTIQITEETTPEIIFEAKALGVIAGKVYPRYVTTNSGNGVVDYNKIYPALGAMQECDMVACFHGEHPSYDMEGPKKESYFIYRILEDIIKKNPKLKIVLEHITTSVAVQWVKSQRKNVAATITPHHMCYTADDVEGYSKASNGKGNVHLICKPKLKWNEDRAALIAAAISSIAEDSHFFYGGDDAAHLRSAKECSGSFCGVFNTREAIPKVIETFLERDAKQSIAPFFSYRGADFYGFLRNTETITFEKKSWVVPPEYPVAGITKSVSSGAAVPNVGTVVSMCAGQTIDWQIVR